MVALRYSPFFHVLGLCCDDYVRLPPVAPSESEKALRLFAVTLTDFVYTGSLLSTRVHREVHEIESGQ